MKPKECASPESYANVSICSFLLTRNAVLKLKTHPLTRSHRQLQDEAGVREWLRGRQELRQVSLCHGLGGRHLQRASRRHADHLRLVDDHVRRDVRPHRHGHRRHDVHQEERPPAGAARPP